MAIALVNAMIPPFVAQYAAREGSTKKPFTEAIFTMQSFDLRKWGQEKFRTQEDSSEVDPDFPIPRCRREHRHSQKPGSSFQPVLAPTRARRSPSRPVRQHLRQTRPASRF